MLKRINEKFNNIDKKILKVMHIGFKLSLFVAILSTFILFTYEFILKLPDLYYSGLLLFKSSLFFFVFFIVCGVAVDTIKKQMA